MREITIMNGEYEALRSDDSLTLYFKFSIYQGQEQWRTLMIKLMYSTFQLKSSLSSS